MILQKDLLLSHLIWRFPMENDRNGMIWYASYGSNICRERFLCYIRGGKPNGSNKRYPGCADKTLPVTDQEIMIQSELYFARSSKTWSGGGVGFLKNHFGGDSQSLGRMYLITRDQFIDVVKQETERPQVTINFDLAIKSGDYVFLQRSWYGRIVYLGVQNGYPIFTFTGEADQEANPPDDAYLKMIIDGIREVYVFSNEEIADYFLTCDGISDRYNKEQLIELCNS